MLQHVTVTIDGADYKAIKGSSILKVAIEYGICIPHLCHVPNLSDIGACRLCIVELIENGRPNITTSCTLNVQEGMVVRTNSEKIRRLRRNIAELLVAEAPNSKVIQDVAARCGVTEVRYPFRNRNCVLCGRCVRICSDMWQARALGFVGRGRERHVDFPFGFRPDFCKMCNSCIDLCPMTIVPCDGPMKEGEEYLCAKCASQLTMIKHSPDSCVWCRLGEGSQCARWRP